MAKSVRTAMTDARSSVLTRATAVQATLLFAKGAAHCQPSQLPVNFVWPAISTFEMADRSKA